MILLAVLATAARADVTISTAVSGPQAGDGGAFTVTMAGSITSGSEGIVASGNGGITTLIVAGSVDVTGSGLLNHAGSTISAVAVSGTLRGSAAVVNYGTIDTLANDGSLEGTGSWAVYHGYGGTLGTLSIGAGGEIVGANHAIGVYGTSGTIASAGSITGVGFGVYVENASLWSFSNSGTTSVGGTPRTAPASG